MSNGGNLSARPTLDQAYDSPSWWYDIRGYFILRLSYRTTLRALIRFFARNVSGNHLEAAIGSGTLFKMVLFRRWLSRLPAPQVVGFDYARPMLAGACKRFKGQAGMHLQHADVACLAYPDNHFESANVANAVHSFPDVNAGLRELHRVLKPGACLAMNVLLYAKGSRLSRRVANRLVDWGIKKGILFSPYGRDDIESRVRAAGFEIVESRETGNVLMLVARKPAPAAYSDRPKTPGEGHLRAPEMGSLRSKAAAV